MTLQDGIARFSLNPARPVPLLDEATLERLRAALEAVERAGARVLIISGGSEGVFAAGADLARLAALGPRQAREFSSRGHRLLDSLQSQPFVTIAGIRGRCIGGAFDLVMACDLRLADTTASFSHPGPRLGFITGYGGTVRLPALVGRSARAVLSGRRVLDATEASRLGLVADVTRPADLDQAIDLLARRIAGVPIRRIRRIKEVIGRLSGSSFRRRLERPICRLAVLADDGPMER